jgi:translation initiation factor IF-3
MKFRGRMITRQEVGREVMKNFSEQISDLAEMDKAPSMEGNTMSVYIYAKER